MPDDPHGQHFAPPGAQRDLADQLAFDRVSGPKVAGEFSLAALDLRRRVRRQDDPGAGEPVLAAVAPAAGLAIQRGRPVRQPAVGPAGSARAVLGPVLVVVMASMGSASAANFGGSSSRYKKAGVVPWGSLRPSSYPGLVAGLSYFKLPICQIKRRSVRN